MARLSPPAAEVGWRLPAFFLFAAALFAVGPAEASRTTTALRTNVAPSPSLELASLELVESTAPVETTRRFGFTEDLGLLDPEAGPGGFVLFARESSRCELTYARNNPLKYVDPDGREEMEAVLMANQRMQLREMGGEEAVRRFDVTNALLAGAFMATVGGGAALHAFGPAVLSPAAPPLIHRASDALGRAREVVVAELTGGRVVNDLKLMTQVGNRLEGVKVDVIGKAGELVAVGGPAKANQLGALGDHLRRLSNAAAARGVTAQAYFQEGTPKAALDLARKLLGEQNVKTFRVAPSS